VTVQGYTVSVQACISVQSIGSVSRRSYPPLSRAFPACQSHLVYRTYVRYTGRSRRSRLRRRHPL